MAMGVFALPYSVQVELGSGINPAGVVLLDQVGEAEFGDELPSKSLIQVDGFISVDLVSNGVLATNNPSWHWSYGGGGQDQEYPVDDRCSNANPPFKVEIYQHDDFDGHMAMICGYWDDLSQLPFYSGFSSPTFDNSISSLWVLRVRSGRCVEFSHGKDQTGTKVRYVSGAIHYVGPNHNDQYSSLRLGC